MSLKALPCPDLIPVLLALLLDHQVSMFASPYCVHHDALPHYSPEIMQPDDHGLKTLHITLFSLEICLHVKIRIVVLGYRSGLSPKGGGTLGR